MAVLLDFHDALADKRVVRRLRNLVPRLAAEQRCVIIVAPELHRPEASPRGPRWCACRCPTRRRSPASSTARGRRLPRRRHASATARHGGASARGLTGEQARRAFLRGLHVDAALGAPAITVILTEKRRILSRDLGLEDIEVFGHPKT